MKKTLTSYGLAASLVTAAVLTSGAALAAPSTARVGVGIGVDDGHWPHKVSVQAGTSVHFGITVRNAGNVSENLGIHASRNPSITASALASVPLDSWVSESPNYIKNVPAGATIHSVVTIKVPANASIGRHYGVVWVTYTPPTGKGISLGSGAGLRQEYDVVKSTGAGTGSACAKPPLVSYLVRQHKARTPNQAAAWAQSRVGETGWNCWCEAFAETAYGHYSYTNAITHFMIDRAHGRLHYWVAPRGAFVFFTGSNPKIGHVEIALGNGRYVTTDSRVRIVDLSYGGKYLGWSLTPYPY